MKIKATYRKIEKATDFESVKTFEIDAECLQANLDDGFWLLNLEKSKTEIKLELWQGKQFVITVLVLQKSSQTLHLKFYDFDIYFGFEILD